MHYVMKEAGKNSKSFNGFQWLISGIFSFTWALPVQGTKTVIRTRQQLVIIKR